MFNSFNAFEALFIRNAQSHKFEIRECISTETAEELYDKNTLNGQPNSFKVNFA